MSQSITIITLVCLFTLFGCKRSQHSFKSGESNGQEKVLNQKVYNQFNLKYLAIGRNTFEVEDFMGVPEGRSLGQNGDYLLDYRRPVIDEESGKVFDWSLITFRFNQGKCTTLEFSLADKPVQLSEVDQLSSKN